MNVKMILKFQKQKLWFLTDQEKHRQIWSESEEKVIVPMQKHV